MPNQTVKLEPYGSVDLSYAERGTGRPVLLLHGGAGPLSVQGLSQSLAERLAVRVIVPTHPGFGGTPRPEWLIGVPRLAAVYARFLQDLDLTDVTVVGSSIGGWVAAELTLLDQPRISQLVLSDAGGIEVEGHPVADIFTLTPQQISELSFHNPAAFAINPATMTDQARAGMAANRVALAAYGGKPPVNDATLRHRLGSLNVPTLVLWGESDRIMDTVYGRAYAAAIPSAEFHLVPKAGHLPFMEAPEPFLDAVQTFDAKRASARPGTPSRT
jgi:pimeloyl-ACP methyl ester carboxylesterase